MKIQTIVGILLIALGIVAFAYQGITYTTTEKAVDLGPLKLTTEKTQPIPPPPVLVAIALPGGILQMILNGKKSA